MKKIITGISVCIVCLFVWQDTGQGQQSAAPNAPARAIEKGEYVDMAAAQLVRLKKQFAERKRKVDPFGAKMDPGTFEDNVEIAEVPDAAPTVVQKKVVSLQEAVNKFQVNGVSPAKQMVMVGFRSLHRGDVVEIEHDGVLFKLRIAKISKNEVVFMNVANEETASVRLGVVRDLSGGSSSALKNKLFDSNKKPVRIK